jgi:AraC-like DNA-binding protein
MNLATKPGARASLGEDQPVGRIAMDCGFFHLGRFAQYYKQKYGMLPSQTVRLALQG